MGTHPIFESDFDCLTEMLYRYLGKWQSMVLRPTVQYMYRYNSISSHVGHPKKRKKEIKSPLLIHKPRIEGLDHFLIACFASTLNLSNNNFDIIQIAKEASHAALILNPLEHSTILNLS